MEKQNSQNIANTGFEINILDGLADPVLLVNENREFIDGNQAAFCLVGKDAIGQDLASVLDCPVIVEAIDRILQGAPSEKGKAVISSPVPRTFDMHIMAIPSGNPNIAGRVMLSLHDISSALQADKMRADFVSNVSHEMRSPLSTLLGFIETLRGPARDDPEAQERFLGIMEEEARRMTRLINDLLTLSQVEADEHILPDHTVNLQELLNEVIDLLSGRAKDRNMSLVLELISPLPLIIGDKDELVQVFRNLVDNALNYGTLGTEVAITAEYQESTVPEKKPNIRVAITNLGEGIEPKHIPRLTERFYRVDKGRSRATGGTGLGLAIVKHIIHRHRGDLDITSVQGQSTTFSVSLWAIKTT